MSRWMENFLLVIRSFDPAPEILVSRWQAANAQSNLCYVQTCQSLQWWLTHCMNEDEDWDQNLDLLDMFRQQACKKSFERLWQVLKSHILAHTFELPTPLCVKLDGKLYWSKVNQYWLKVISIGFMSSVSNGGQTSMTQTHLPVKVLYTRVSQK